MSSTSRQPPASLPPRCARVCSGLRALHGSHGVQQTAHETSDLESELGFVRTFLLIFATSPSSSCFIIFNTFSITVAQRTRELGSCARSRDARAADRSVVGRACSLVSAAVLGLLLGIGVAPGLDQLFKSFGADLPDSGTVVETRTIVVRSLPEPRSRCSPASGGCARLAVPRSRPARRRLARGVPIRHSNVGRLARLAAGAIASSPWSRSAPTSPVRSAPP